MNKEELVYELKTIYPGEEIRCENRRNMISDQWFIFRSDRMQQRWLQIGNDVTELKALKNAVALSAPAPFAPVFVA